MATLDIEIDQVAYRLSADESNAHLEEVAELVKRRVENLRKKSPELTREKAAMIAAFDFASQLIKGTRRASDAKSAILTKAKLLLARVENDLRQ